MPTSDPAAHQEQIARAAWAYYQDGLKQSEIATTLGVSRATVVNYLSEARARGYVRVTLHPNVFVEHALSGEVADALGLARVLVVPDGATPENTLRRVAKAAADWLPSLLEAGDSLGVSWGQTIFSLSEAASRTPIDGLKVVQLVGSLATPLGFAAETCSANLARQFQAECVNLHAPLLLSSADLARQLKSEPTISRQLAAVRECNKTVFAAGSCAEKSHVVASGVVTSEQLKTYVDRGAVGVICGRFIDKDGQPVPGEMDDRMIGATQSDMTGKAMGLLVSAGADRIAPALAAVRGCYATHVVTHTSNARALLSRTRARG